MKRKTAFSLVELLVSLIIISLIVVTFVPLMTKRLINNRVSLSNGITTKCQNNSNFGSDCKLCTSSRCLICAIEDCGSGKFPDSDSCSCKECTFGNKCKECTSENCTKCIEGYFLDSLKNCSVCNIENCESCLDLRSANNPLCSSCISGYVLKDGKCYTCQELFGANCAACTALACTACSADFKLGDASSSDACASEISDEDFIEVEGLLVTKKNMGDSSVLAIPSGIGVTIAAAGQNCSGACCWRGTTSSGCDSSSTPNYSGCTRTNCTWSAANLICSNYTYGSKKWRLPTAAEMANWNNYSKGLGEKGLQLCDFSAGYSATRCYCGTSKCPGACDSYCHSHGYWSSTPSGSSYYRYHLDSGAFTLYTNAASYAFSVRCVSEL